MRGIRVIRVFPRRTSLTPNDSYAFVGSPPMWRPEAEEVHVSCTFTWDVSEAIRLQQDWGQYYPIVKLGGPAIKRDDSDFLPGFYLKNGVTFTSKGCNNNCSWCLVPEYEGKLRELPDFSDGHIIQDNNLLQCSLGHIKEVFDMLRSQRKAAVFSGGIDARLVTDPIAELFRSIRIRTLFLAADTTASLLPLQEAVEKLSFLRRDKLQCYVLIGKDEDIRKSEFRLKRVWEIGCLPFAQLYQPRDHWIGYNSEWKDLARQYSRPAITKAVCRHIV